jgi:hypothetical protein
MPSADGVRVVAAKVSGSSRSNIDKKSLFGIPQSASTHTGRKHAGTGLTQRCHRGEAWQKPMETSIPPPNSVFVADEVLPGSHKDAVWVS